MTKADMILSIFYLVGVFNAWFQIHIWIKESGEAASYDGCAIGIASLLSWGIYPISFVIWFFNKR